MNRQPYYDVEADFNIGLIEKPERKNFTNENTVNGQGMKSNFKPTGSYIK